MICKNDKLKLCTQVIFNQIFLNRLPTAVSTVYIHYSVQLSFVLIVSTLVILSRKLTVADALERCLKKGKGEEQSLAAITFCLLCIQLGITDNIESIYAPLRSLFLTILKDPSAALKARSSVSFILQ